MFSTEYYKDIIIINYKQNHTILCEAQLKELINDNKKGLYIKSIITPELYRNKGYATTILNYIFTFHDKYNFIILDDCSENLPPNNLYYKLNCLVKKFDKDYNYTWVKWKDNIDLSVDEERLWII